jgi:hypothetical protein
VASEYDNKIHLYALANPGDFLLESKAVTRAVLEALEVPAAPNHRVRLSQSAWLDYTVVDELWTRRAPPALPSAGEAQKAAEAVLAKLERTCSAANPNWPQRLKTTPLLPPVSRLRRAGLVAVARPDGSAWDHWLYRAEPRLALDGAQSRLAGVFGAHVEVRIGHGCRPISVRSRWRPLSGERRFTELSPFVEPPGHDEAENNGDEHEHEHEHEEPIINYVLEGEGMPQHYLAPYYLTSDGHIATMVSATPYSLTVDVGRTRQSGRGMTLSALARGGSGDYAYNWAIYSVASMEEGLRELGPGESERVETVDGKAIMSSVDVDNGHYVAMLNVKDRATGAFKHHQQQVFTHGFAANLADMDVA